MFDPKKCISVRDYRIQLEKTLAGHLPTILDTIHYYQESLKIDRQQAILFAKADLRERLHARKAYVEVCVRGFQRMFPDLPEITEKEVEFLAATSDSDEIPF